MTQTDRNHTAARVSAPSPKRSYRPVPAQIGWDCHGLPVEIAVEKELGINGEAEIEAYGVEAFNARCRESMLRHVDAFTERTTRADGG